MSSGMYLALVLMVMAVAYQWALVRSKKVVHHDTRQLHSRPAYYGWSVALWCGIPAVLVLLTWFLIEPFWLQSMIVSALPPEIATGLDSRQTAVLMQRIQNLASGFSGSESVAAHEQLAAQQFSELKNQSRMVLLVLIGLIMLSLLVFRLQRLHANYRARNHVERVIRIALTLCSAIAILTTVGIVLAMLGEAFRCFSFVSPMDFFFGTTWNPRFSSTSGGDMGYFGLLPVLVGTMMVSVIALLVAVPLGLMTAIYLAEYASPRFRALAKPTLEVLAGIPTIVYGVFALIVIGPLFNYLGGLVGLEIRATSALTAGFVMGIMIIPFVSSLSDDVITQVPRAMRDGSLGLGATKAETITKVIIPAALPGIVGAFLLAASRAIGETMIVVLAAGKSPILHGNPLDAVGTVTVSIVNQLTGDTDFASPQSLVAFALGLTLFAITLLLNVVALYIVRKYREQYE